MAAEVEIQRALAGQPLLTWMTAADS